MRRKIRINFTDFFNGFDKERNDFTRILRERYDVEISDTPEYLFYSTFGTSYLKYDCIRIFYTGECIAPNFNMCDYAIGFDYINFGDRYLRVPLYELFQYRQSFCSLVEDHVNDDKRSGFCSFVCSNDQGMKERIDMFHLLSRYKRVDSGGRYLNNVGGPVEDKRAFDQQHKFSIAFENSSFPGYTTEKIVEAFAAGAIPIYYGNPEIDKEFNEKAFINCHRFASLEEAAEYVEKIDQNDELYRQMRSEPIIKKEQLSEEPLRSFLFHIAEQPYKTAVRRPSNTRTDEMEYQLKVYSAYHRIWYKWWRKVKAAIRRIKKHAV